MVARFLGLLVVSAVGLLTCDTSLFDGFNSGKRPEDGAVAGGSLARSKASAQGDSALGNSALGNSAQTSRSRRVSLRNDDPVAHVREFASEDEAERALAHAEAYLARLSKGKQSQSLDKNIAGRLQWLAVQAAIRADETARATRHAERLGRSDHPLAPWARLEHAKLIERTESQKAARIAGALTHPWPGKIRARRIEARSLAAAGKYDQAVPKLRALVAETPDHVASASAGLPLARILAKRKDRTSREEALGLYRRVMTRVPLLPMAERAEERAKEILSGLPPSRRRALRKLPIDDRWMRAEKYYQSMAHEKAEDAFKELAKALRRSPKRRCEALLMQGKAMLRQKKRKEGAPLLSRVARACREPEVRAWAHYKAGRAYAALGKRPQALREYAALVRRVPGHSLADDALLRAALVEDDAEQSARTRRRVRQRLRKIPKAYPNGDMAHEALFRLAWLARKERRFSEALKHYEKLETVTVPRQEDTSGRSAYWRARTLADLKKTAPAKNAYAELAKNYPLSYYAQQALARLAELGIPIKTSSVEAFGTPETDSDDAASTLDPPPSERPTAKRPTTKRPTAKRPIPERWAKQPAFARATELLAVGELELAKLELDQLGLLRRGASRDDLVFAATLLHRFSAFGDASRLIRRRMSSFREQPPVGEHRRIWRIAYPNAFSPLIETHANAQSIPPSFVRAIAREESAFSPRAVSHSRAYGLVQVILPTAKRFAPDGATITPSTLRDADLNLAVGTRFMSFLWQRYPTNRALVPAAYNAGQHAVDRWLKRNPNRPLDEFIEDIPYDETRRYTRRVLQTYGTYSWLETGELHSLL